MPKIARACSTRSAAMRKSKFCFSAVVDERGQRVVAEQLEPLQVGQRRRPASSAGSAPRNVAGVSMTGRV